MWSTTESCFIGMMVRVNKDRDVLCPHRPSISANVNRTGHIDVNKCYQSRALYCRCNYLASPQTYTHYYTRRDSTSRYSNPSWNQHKNPGQITSPQANIFLISTKHKGKKLTPQSIIPDNRLTLTHHKQIPKQRKAKASPEPHPTIGQRTGKDWPIHDVSSPNLNQTSAYRPSDSAIPGLEKLPWRRYKFSGP